jgi:hypothetical protein
MQATTITIILVIALLTGACGRTESAPSTNNNDSASSAEHKYSGEFDFKGIKLGMSEKEVRGLFPSLSRGMAPAHATKSMKVLMCETQYEGSPHQCKSTIANQQIRKAAFVFDNNHLTEMFIEFSADYFRAVVDGLTAKYGQPTNIYKRDLKFSLTGVASTYNRAFWSNNSNHGLSVDDHEIDGSSYRPRGLLVIVDFTHGLLPTQKQDKDDI